MLVDKNPAARTSPSPFGGKIIIFKFRNRKPKIYILIRMLVRFLEINLGFQHSTNITNPTLIINHRLKIQFDEYLVTDREINLK